MGVIFKVSKYPVAELSEISTLIPRCPFGPFLSTEMQGMS
jgi:hypothetical protein